MKQTKAHTRLARAIADRRREIKREYDEATLAIAAMIPVMEAVARNGKTAENRKLAREWLALVTPEEREALRRLRKIDDQARQAKRRA